MTEQDIMHNPCLDIDLSHLVGISVTQVTRCVECQAEVKRTTLDIRQHQWDAAKSANPLACYTEAGTNINYMMLATICPTCKDENI